MPFQFSMKWVLAAMAYAAVAAAAYTQRVGVYVDLLWGSSVVAFTYAVLVARHAEGERQAWATGFAVLWLCTVAWMHLSPDAFPTQRLFDQFGGSGAVEVLPLVFEVQLADLIPSYVPEEDDGWPQGPSRDRYQLRNAPYAPPSAAPPMLPAPNPPLAARPRAPRLAYVDPHGLRLRTLNAVATMLAGILGGMLGSLAYKNSLPAR